MVKGRMIMGVFVDEVCPSATIGFVEDVVQFLSACTSPLQLCALLNIEPVLTIFPTMKLFIPKSLVYPYGASSIQRCSIAITDSFPFKLKDPRYPMPNSSSLSARK